jgi:hypothetical protein
MPDLEVGVYKDLRELSISYAYEETQILLIWKGIPQNL